MSVTCLSKEEILSLLPQQRPFRFLDEILEVDEQRIAGKYTFRHDEVFYAGHFPARAITPGVILFEAMGQLAVAHSIYLTSLEEKKEMLSNYLSFFTDGSIEFFLPVLPGDTVTMYAEKVFWRQRKLRSKVEMFRGETLVASCISSGMGIKP